MIISFGWTSPALLAGQKSVTRRDWKPEHAAKFRPGTIVDAWDRVARMRPYTRRMGIPDPHKIATIRLTEPLRLESPAGLSDLEERREGFWYLREHGHEATVARIIQGWASDPRPVYVVRFEVVEYLEGPIYNLGAGWVAEEERRLIDGDDSGGPDPVGIFTLGEALQ